MSDQQWREITLEDLRGMTPDEQKTCRVRIGDEARDVFEVDVDEIVYTVRGGLVQDWVEGELDHWNAVYEAPVPPSRPLPTHEGAVIRLNRGPVQQFDGDHWWEPGDDSYLTNDEVQRLANTYGWVELVPADGPDAEDARAAAIREVEADFRAQDLFNTAARVRDRFPEAFSGAVNPKEIGDE